MVKQKVLEYANLIGRVKMGSKNGIKAEHAEYKILEPIVTEEMAEVGLCLRTRDPQTLEEVATACGKPIEKTKELLWQLCDRGAAAVTLRDGIDTFWLEIWVPGHMELIVNSKYAKIHPAIPRAFEEYGRRKGPLAIGNFPVGAGPMRVIPIERSIDGNSKKASFEEVSKYVREATRISVSDCSCRTSREALGEGCGHLKEDMCLQLNHAAEFYIRTGKGREVTKEEATEILRRAEDNGLMHQIPNTEGSGKTHAICNCCGCSCYALRNVSLWGNADFVRSNYVSEVDTEKCVACGECVENCPTNALQLGQKLCTTTPIKMEKKINQRDHEWGQEKWNEDYRTNRKVVVESGTSPCKAECPAHIGIQGYIKLASQGRYTEALELIKHENPFPAVCGRICPRNCESACTRGDIDDPIAIDDIKKFIAEQDLNADVRYMPTKRHDYGKKIAIVGAGPGGLSCAFYLAIDGYKVTVFEKEKALGGMLTLGIPSFRLEKEVINAEIEILRELGVEFSTGLEIGKDKSLQQLRDEGFEAFYLAIGAQKGRMIQMDGADAKGVMAGLDFLKQVNLGEDVKLSGKTIIIGGGNVAIDVARTATRVGSEQVDMYCLESFDQMPALQEEIDEAVAEDIAINNSWGPIRILTENGKVSGVEFRKCLSVVDENGKFNPKYDDSDIKVVEASNVLISVGQGVDWGGIIEASKVKLNPNNTIIADPVTYQTDEPDVFAGGDALTGPKFAIDAIAQGKEGAISIHRFVHPGQSLLLGRLNRDYKPLDKANLDLKGYDRMPRQEAAHPSGKESKETFKDLRGTLTQEQIEKEADRCISCGATVVDEFMCVGCGQCVTNCKFDAISLVKKYDAIGLDLPEMKPTVMKHAIKRKVKLTVKKPINAVKAILDK